QLFYKQRENNGPGVIVGAKSSISNESIDPGYPKYAEDQSVATAQLTGVDVLRNHVLIVTQLATRNEKFSFLSFNPKQNKLSDFGIKSGTFKLNGNEYEIDAENTSVGDFAGFINDLDAGVIASLNEAGQIIFNAQNWGESGNIQFEDGSSNIALILNMTDSVRGQDAKFSFGDEYFERASNHITDAIPGAIFDLKSRGVTEMDLRPIITGGKLKGLMEIKEGMIDDMVSRLDRMAFELVKGINLIHKNGFGLDGKSGRNFFTPFKEVSEVSPWQGAAASIDLSQAVKSDLNAIAASKGIYTESTDRLRSFAGSGNADNLIEMAQLRYKLVFNNGQSNFDDYYDEIVSIYSTASSDAGVILSYEESVKEQLSKRRDSVSAVSLDEELANTIKFQQAYNAAARMVRMVDELLDVIINNT
ncbi:flagellar basal body rod C-terminal domain-containing protein, partial [Candidatus Riflebacteria bacterium]